MNWDVVISEKLTYEVLPALHLVVSDLQSQSDPRRGCHIMPSGDVLKFSVLVARSSTLCTELSLRFKLHHVCCPADHLKLTTECWDGNAWREISNLTGPLIEFDREKFRREVRGVWENAEIVALL